MASSKLFFFSSRRRHTRYWRDWSSDVCSSDLNFMMLHEHLLDISHHFEVHPHTTPPGIDVLPQIDTRSEERRVGKECRTRWARHHDRKNNNEQVRIGRTGGGVTIKMHTTIVQI